MNELLCKDIESGHISHAYLFFGKEAVIEKEADDFIASILCRNSQGGMACGKCSHCIQFRQGTYPYLVRMEPLTFTYKKEQYLEIRHLFGLAGGKNNPIIFCFEKADRMEEEFSDRLLKSLEEPAPNVVFLLLAENEDMVRQTVKSRCRIIRFLTEELIDAEYIGEVAEVLKKVRCGSVEDVFHFAEQYEKSSEAVEAFFAAAVRILGSNYAFRNGGENVNYLLPAESWSTELLLSSWQWALSAPVLISAKVTLRMIVENFLLWIKRNGGSHGNCSWCTL